MSHSSKKRKDSKGDKSGNLVDSKANIHSDDNNVNENDGDNNSIEQENTPSKIRRRIAAALKGDLPSLPTGKSKGSKLKFKKDKVKDKDKDKDKENENEKGDKDKAKESTKPIYKVKDLGQSAPARMKGEKRKGSKIHLVDTAKDVIEKEPGREKDHKDKDSKEKIKDKAKEKEKQKVQDEKAKYKSEKKKQRDSKKLERLVASNGHGGKKHKEGPD
jgi:hypothetical protein